MRRLTSYLKLLAGLSLVLMHSSCNFFSLTGEDTAQIPEDTRHRTAFKFTTNCDTKSKGSRNHVDCGLYHNDTEDGGEERITLHSLSGFYEITWTIKQTGGAPVDLNNIQCGSNMQEEFLCTISNPPHLQAIFEIDFVARWVGEGQRPDVTDNDSITLPVGAHTLGIVPIANGGKYHPHYGINFTQNKVGYHPARYAANTITFGSINSICESNGQLFMTSNEYVYTLDKETKNGVKTTYANHFAGSAFGLDTPTDRKSLRLHNKPRVLGCNKDFIIANIPPVAGLQSSSVQLALLPRDISKPPQILAIPDVPGSVFSDIHLSDDEVILLQHTEQTGSYVIRYDLNTKNSIKYFVQNYNMIRMAVNPTTNDVYGVIFHESPAVANIYVLSFQDPTPPQTTGRASLTQVGDLQAETIAFQRDGQLYASSTAGKKIMRLEGVSFVETGIDFAETSDWIEEITFSDGTFPDNMSVRIKGRASATFRTQSVDRVYGFTNGQKVRIAGIETLIQNPDQDPLVPKKDYQFFSVKYLAVSPKGHVLVADDPNRSKVSLINPDIGPDHGFRTIAARASDPSDELVTDLTTINRGQIGGMTVTPNGDLYLTAGLQQDSRLYRIQSPEALYRSQRPAVLVPMSAAFVRPRLLTHSPTHLYIAGGSGIYSLPAEYDRDERPKELIRIATNKVNSMTYHNGRIVLSRYNENNTRSYLQFYRKGSSGWELSRTCVRYGFKIGGVSFDSQNTLYFLEGGFPNQLGNSLLNPDDYRLQVIHNFDEHSDLHCPTEDGETTIGKLDGGTTWLDFAKERMEQKREHGADCRAGQIVRSAVNSSVGEANQSNMDKLCKGEVSAFEQRDNCTIPYANDPHAKRQVSLYLGMTVGANSSQESGELGQVVVLQFPCQDV